MADVKSSGVDTSIYQKYPDWVKVKASGVDFAIIKASQGNEKKDNTDSTYKISPFTDRYFLGNIKKAYDAGIKVGVYHLMRGRNVEDIQIEIRYFLNVIRPYKSLITYPVCMDMEMADYSRYTKAQITQFIKTGAEMIRAEGYQPMVYSSAYLFRKKIDFNGLDYVDNWVAVTYDGANPNSLPSGIPKIDIWQWTQKCVDGIDGVVDYNACYKSYGEPIRGDTDGNGVLDEIDILLDRKHLAGNLDLTDEQLKRADLDGDGLDSIDVLKKRRKLTNGEW